MDDERRRRWREEMARIGLREEEGPESEYVVIEALDEPHVVLVTEVGPDGVRETPAMWSNWEGWGPSIRLSGDDSGTDGSEGDEEDWQW